MAAIQTKEDFQRWLTDKPDEIVRGLSFRIALRVIPLANVRGPGFDLAIVALRALFMSWTTGIWRTEDMAYAVHAAISAAAAAAETASIVMTQTGYSTPTELSINVDASMAARNAVYAAGHAAHITTDPLAAAADVAFFANEATTFAIGTAATWESIAADTDWIDTQFQVESELRSGDGSWPVLQLGTRLANRWQSVKAELIARDENWDIWIDWYDRRVNGERLGWNVDKRKHEALCIGLALESEMFWDRPPAEVNADIAARVEAARPRYPLETLPSAHEIFIADGRLTAKRSSAAKSDSLNRPGFAGGSKL